MDYSRILIIKPSSLGDIVHALPAAAALRRLYPVAALTWLVKPEWSEILEGNPGIDEIVILPTSARRWLQTVRLLRAKRFDLVVDLQGLLRSGLLAWLTGARIRVGYAAAREGSWVFYTHRVPLPVAKAPWRLLDLHAVDRNLAVVASLGSEVRNPQFSIASFPSDQLATEAWLREAGVQPGDQLVAIAPVDRRGVRSWPLERFVAAASALGRMHGVRIVLVGASADDMMSARFRAAVGDKLVDLLGKTRVRQLGALLRRVNLLIANDSAPIHIAAAVGTPVLALFGPTNHVRARPYGEGHVVLRTGISCSPCEKLTCANPNQYECLTAISVTDVVETARTMLNKSEVAACR